MSVVTRSDSGSGRPAPSTTRAELAAPHARTEKDPYSILSMLETNVLHLDRLSSLLATRSSLHRVFRLDGQGRQPEQHDGVTKRLMEHALFHPTQPWSERVQIFTDPVRQRRFLERIVAGGRCRHPARPFVRPDSTRRFFVSLSESGHPRSSASLGLIAVMIPTLDPDANLVLLSDVAAISRLPRF